MDAYLFIGILILVFVGVPIGLGLLLYFVPKKFGYPKTGKYLIVIFGLLVLTIVSIVTFEDQFFTKNDAQELVSEQDLFLKDKFDLVKNKSSSAIGGDYYHIFILKISEQDKLNAIVKIKNSADFKRFGEPVAELSNNSDRYNGPKRIQNYETQDEYVREYFKPSGQKGYAPTFRRISIDKKENKLVFEDMNE